MKLTGKLIGAAVVLAASIGLGLSTASASVRPTPPDNQNIKGKLATDGVLTVSQLETVRVKGLSPKTKLDLEVVPPATKSCFEDLTRVCVSAPISRAPGTPRFRTNGKGRALLTFVTPDHYDLFNLRIEDRVPAPFTNGQGVVVRASGLHVVRHHGNRDFIFAVAQAGAVVQTAQPAPAP
jgi:hypothetical protein